MNMSESSDHTPYETMILGYVAGDEDGDTYDGRPAYVAYLTTPGGRRMYVAVRDDLGAAVLREDSGSVDGLDTEPWTLAWIASAVPVLRTHARLRVEMEGSRVNHANAMHRVLTMRALLDADRDDGREGITELAYTWLGTRSEPLGDVWEYGVRVPTWKPQDSLDALLTPPRPGPR